MHLSFSHDLTRDAFPVGSQMIKEEMHPLSYEKRSSQSPNGSPIVIVFSSSVISFFRI